MEKIKHFLLVIINTLRSLFSLIKYNIKKNISLNSLIHLFNHHLKDKKLKIQQQ